MSKIQFHLPVFFLYLEIDYVLWNNYLNFIIALFRAQETQMIFGILIVLQIFKTGRFFVNTIPRSELVMTVTVKEFSPR